MVRKIKINSYEQYRELLHQQKLYNNGFSKAEITKYIHSDRAFAFEEDSATVFAYDEYKYWHMIIPVDVQVDQLRNIIKDFDRPIVCYVVTQMSEKMNAFEEFLLKSGFQKNQTIREYGLDNLETINTEQIPLLDIPQERDVEEILDLWLNNLPVVEMPFLSKENMNYWRDRGQLFCIKDNAHVIGACCYDAFLGKITVSHVVVSPDERGKGYAFQLINGCIKSAKKKGLRSARAWIEERNVSSQKCFTKIGFRMTSTISIIYIHTACVCLAVN